MLCLLLFCNHEHKLSGLKQYTFVILQFLWVRSGHSFTGSPTQGLTSLQSRWRPGLWAHQRLKRREIWFKLSKVHRTYLLWQQDCEVPVSLAVCWELLLAPGGHLPSLPSPQAPHNLAVTSSQLAKKTPCAWSL